VDRIDRACVREEEGEWMIEWNARHGKVQLRRAPELEMVLSTIKQY